jgi:hypothetical protein
MVDSVDGRSRYVDIGNGEARETALQGAVIHIEPRTVEARAVDRTVAEIAAANGGATISISISGTIRPRAPPSPRPMCDVWKRSGVSPRRRAGAGRDVDHRARSCETGGGLRAPASRGCAGRGADAIRPTDQAAARRGRCHLIGREAGRRRTRAAPR